MSIPYFPPGLLNNPDEMPPAQMGALLGGPATQGPTAAPTPASTFKPSLFDRFRHSIINSSPKLAEMFFPTPEGGLLTPEQTHGARTRGLLDASQSLLESSGYTTGPAPTLGQAVGRASAAARSGYDEAVQGQMQGGLLADQQKQRTALMQSRAQIQQKYANAFRPGAPEQEVEQALKAMFGDFSRSGDAEFVGKLAQIIPSLSRQAAGHDIEHIDAGDHVEIVDPSTGRTLRTIAKGLVPKTAAEVSADQKFKSAQKDKIGDDYARDTKDFHQVMAGWDVLQGATKDPTLATPFAITDAYARITNPGAIVRPTTLEMIDHMGSVGQRMQKWWAQHADGSLPPEIVNDFKKTLYNIVKMHHDQYQQIRSKALTRAQQAGIPDMDNILQDYKLEDPSAPSSPGAAKPANSILTRHGAPPGR